MLSLFYKPFPNVLQFGGTFPCQLFFPGYLTGELLDETISKNKASGGREEEFFTVSRSPKVNLPHAAKQQPWHLAMGLGIKDVSLPSSLHTTACPGYGGVYESFVRRKNKCHAFPMDGRNLQQICHHKSSFEEYCFSSAQEQIFSTKAACQMSIFLLAIKRCYPHYSH